MDINSSTIPVLESIKRIWILKKRWKCIAGTTRRLCLPVCTAKKSSISLRKWNLNRKFSTDKQTHVWFYPRDDFYQSNLWKCVSSFSQFVRQRIFRFYYLVNLQLQLITVVWRRYGLVLLTAGRRNPGSGLTGHSTFHFTVKAQLLNNLPFLTVWTYWWLRKNIWKISPRYSVSQEVTIFMQI